MANLVPAVPTSVQNTLVSQQQSIVGLQKQLGTIQSEFGGINNGLQGIATVIQRDSTSDQNRLLQEREREKRLTESQIRAGKESELEQALDDSLKRPIQALEPKLRSTFGGAQSALNSLFKGFLAVGVIGAIAKTGQLVVDNLSNIKSNVNNSLGFVSSTFSSLKTGIGNVIKNIGKVAKNIMNFVSNLIKSPKETISNLLKGKKTSDTSGNSGTGSGSQASSAAVSTPEESMLSGVLKGISDAAPATGTAAGTAATSDTKDSSAKPAPAETSAPPSPPPPAASTETAGNATGSATTGLVSGDLFNNTNQAISNKGPDFSNFNPNINTNNVQDASKLNFSTEAANTPASTDTAAAFTTKTPAAETQPTENKTQVPQQAAVSSTTTENKQQITGTTQTSIPAIASVQTNQEKPAQAQIEAPPKTTTVGAKPPPPPNVITASSVSQQTPPPQQSPTRSGPVADIPLIPSANTDNFYTLYAQSHYNVVI